MRRKGFTLVELMVVLGIVSVLLMLLAGAIQRVRMAAARVQCLNHMRQIGTAMTLTVQRGAYLAINDAATKARANYFFTPHESLLEDLDYKFNYYDPSAEIWRGFQIPLLLCPADSSVRSVPRAYINRFGVETLSVEHLFSTSYRCNVLAFHSAKRIPQDITDGLSNTLAMVECNTFIQNPDQPIHYLYQFEIKSKLPKDPLTNLAEVPSLRGAGFAHKVYGDIYPVRGDDGKTAPSVENVTFLDGEISSPLAGAVPVSPHRGGMQILKFDGSANWIKKTIDPVVFWASVTPDWGD